MQNIIQGISGTNHFLSLSSFSKIKEDFYANFIVEDRWKLYLEGLGVTLKVTFFALLLGIVIGALIAIIRSTYEKNHKEMKKGVFGILKAMIRSVSHGNFMETKKEIGNLLFCFLNFIARVYLTVIRGTPVVIQIMIMFYIIFASSNNKVLVAVLAFGINSGAYVAEIFRSGIMSIDDGQFEAGRSLGFNYPQTMIFIIIPQAFKNVLPTLANEFIVLLKETAVSGYVALTDLTRAGDIVRSRTFAGFIPLFGVAAAYLVMVMFFTWLVGKLERRLRNDER